MYSISVDDTLSRVTVALQVRWQSGIKGQYRFGWDGKFDLNVW